MASMMGYTLLIVIGLLIVTYRIRNLPEEFSIIRELVIIIIIVILQVIVYLVIVIIMYKSNDFDIENAILDDDGGNTILSNSRYLYFISAI